MSEVWCANCKSLIPEDASTCPNCGQSLTDGSKVVRCASCGKFILKNADVCPECGALTSAVQIRKAPSDGITCQRCGSRNVSVQMVQENRGGHTVTKTTAKIRQVKHGLLWWLFIGWWWWIIDVMLWLFAFPFRLAYGLLKKKRYVKTETSVSSTKNSIHYKKVCVCQNCGRSWDI